MEKITVGKRFKFDSAHFIKDHPKCGVVHGHTWHLEVEIEGYMNPHTGMIIDFHELSKIMKPLINKLDHVMLNEVVGVEITCETLCIYICENIKKKFEKCKQFAFPYNVTCTLQEGDGGWAKVTR